MTSAGGRFVHALFAKFLVFILDSTFAIVLRSAALSGNSPLRKRSFVNFINTWNIYKTRPHERINEFYCCAESNVLETERAVGLDVSAHMKRGRTGIYTF